MTRSKWWWIVVAYATAVFIVSVIPVTPTVSLPHLDKLVHLCEYLLFAWLLMQALRTSQFHEPVFGLWAWIYATSYGVLMELVQAMVPWRSASLIDIAMNAVGATLGVWIGQRWPRGRVG